jgi:hypothetical protein
MRCACTAGRASKDDWLACPWLILRGSPKRLAPQDDGGVCGRMTVKRVGLGGANGSRQCAPDDKLHDTHHVLKHRDGFREGLNPPYAQTLPVDRIAGTLASCDLFGIPLTSHWTGAVIIA